MKTDEIQIEILPNGDLKIATDKISAENHTSADGLLKVLGQLMGGEVTAKQKQDRAHLEHSAEQKLKQS